MKRIFSLTLGLLAAMASQAADTIYTKAPQIPILLERNDNVLFYMRMDAKDTKKLDEVTVTFDKCSRRIHFQPHTGKNLGCQPVLFHQERRMPTDQSHLDSER